MRRLVPLAFALALVLAACGDSSSPITTVGASATTSTSAAATTGPGSAELPRIKVEDGVKTEGPDTISVRVGETVRFEIETDNADEVHVHGYDLSFETTPGEESLVEFVVDATGIFEVELHEAGIQVVDIEVTP